MMKSETSISSRFDYSPHYLEVNGSKMHYIEQGSGDPILFIHGMPTSSYLWRNIIPSVSQYGRCIALDLIGMGRSEKPEIEYTLQDHINYVEGFIQNLELQNITLVMHGWGSVIGFDYARRHENNIKAMAFYEAHIRPATDWDMLSLPVQQLASFLNRPGASYRAVIENNYLIEKLLPRGVIRPLSQEEMDYYRKPFSTPECRKLLWQYVQDLPLGDGPSNVVNLIERYSRWLKTTKIPKLMMYAVPGFITTMATVSWAKKHFSNCELKALEYSLHFAQESNPELFSTVLSEWLSNVCCPELNS